MKLTLTLKEENNFNNDVIAQETIDFDGIGGETMTEKNVIKIIAWFRALSQTRKEKLTDEPPF